MSIYKEGMLCKHFKGKTLEEKNIYRIVKLGVSGKDIDQELITYTGDGDLMSATDLVVYANIFQDDKLFTREDSDISKELSLEKQEMYNQKLRVQPLTKEEIEYVSSEDFKAKKFEQEKNKTNIKK